MDSYRKRLKMDNDIPSVKDVNLKLSQHTTADPGYYPPAERAGFNFGKDICSLVEALEIPADEFFRGLLKPIIAQQRRLKADAAVSAPATATATAPAPVPAAPRGEK